MPKSQLFVISFVMFAICTQSNVCAKEPTTPVFSDRFDHVGVDGLPKGWTVWKPKNIALTFESSTALARSGGHSIRVTGAGNPHAKGALRNKVTGLHTGEYYKVVVRYTTRGIRSVNPRVFPFLSWADGKQRWQTIAPVAIEKGWLRAEGIHRLNPDAEGALTIELFSGWIPEGSVYWDSVELHHLPDYTPPLPRKVNVAVIDSRPARAGTVEDNCDFYVSQINHACQQEKLDVICLTETFNQLDVQDTSTSVVTMDGEYMTRIKQAACENRVNLVGSIKEDDGGVQFNTGFLIDRDGKVVDKYRKAQLAMTEVIFEDVSQGDEIKVMQADFGKIGILICWDYQFPEVARSLSLKGAEILFCPIAGCARITEAGRSTGMEHVGKTVAIENRVPMVFSRWATHSEEKPSLIVDAHAQIVASSSKKPYLSAIVELDAPISHWGGTRFSSEYFTMRRPELYDVLSDDTLRVQTPAGPVRIPSSDATTSSFKTPAQN